MSDKIRDICKNCKYLTPTTADMPFYIKRPDGTKIAGINAMKEPFYCKKISNYITGGYSAFLDDLLPGFKCGPFDDRPEMDSCLYWEPKNTGENTFATDRNDFNQHTEENEFRYLSPAWLNELAKGLTKGAKQYPGETWRDIPADEHAWRAARHLIMWLAGDRSDTHIINASMRCMMAFEADMKNCGHKKEGN